MEALMLAGATVIDGLGNEPTRLDVRVRDGRIAELGERLAPAAGEAILDLAGAELMPGLIDVHSHDDNALLRPGAMDPKLSQGVTTVVVGNCGHGPAPSGPRAAIEEYSTPILGPFPAREFPAFADYLDHLDAAGTDTNAVALAPHAPLRAAVIGMEQRRAERAESDRIAGLLDDALQAGAAGLSLGLMYAPGNAAARDELAGMAGRLAARGKLLVAHIRNEADQLEASLDELLELGRAAGCAVHVSHLKVAGPRNFGVMARAVTKLEAARAQGVDVTADVYPYAAGSTTAATMFPNWATVRGTESLLEVLADPAGRARAVRDLGERWDGPLENFFESVGPENILLAGFGVPENEALEGHSLARIAELRGAGDGPLAAAEVLVDLMLEERAGLTAVLFHTDESGMEEALAWEHSLVGSDGLPRESGYVHPRLFGTFPRVLARYAGVGKAMTRVEAVRRMTSASADRFGIGGARIAVGERADLLAVDPAAFADRASYAAPRELAAGVRLVAVNGRSAWSAAGPGERGAGRLARVRPLEG